MTALLATTVAAIVLAVGWRLRPLPASRADLSSAHASPSGEPRRRLRPNGPLARPVVVASATVLGLTAWLLLGPMPTALLAAAVLLGQRERRRRKVLRVASIRSSSLPAAVDLLVVALAAGLTIRQALRLVAERGPRTLRSPFAEVVGRMDAGEAMTVALPRLIADLGEPARGFVRAIIVADRDGVPLRALLGRIAEQARRERRHVLEAAIRRLPVRLAFPLVGCVLPAFVVLTIVPVVGAGLQRLGPIGL